MLSDKAKELFGKLKTDYCPVAIKFAIEKPENVPHTERAMSLCEFVREAQRTGQKFYITKENENCVGKMVLGMEGKPAVGASGQAGYDFGVYKSPAPCARLYQQIPTMIAGTVNYVIFSPVALCDFDPDLVVFVLPLETAYIVMRATSYISGDLWESKTSPVISCAWTYIYPYVSGRVNFSITGMHHGMARRKVYPAGLHIITVPYQKLYEVVQALDEMDWTLISFRDDEESQKELSRRMKHWGEIAASLGGTFSLPENKK